MHSIKNVKRFKYEEYIIMSFFLSGNIPKAIRMKNIYIKPIDLRNDWFKKSYQKYVVIEQTKL